MNTLLWKRRWYAARPWVKDGFAALILITAIVGWYRLMAFAAFMCHVHEWCS